MAQYKLFNLRIYNGVIHSLNLEPINNLKWLHEMHECFLEMIHKEDI